MCHKVMLSKEEMNHQEQIQNFRVKKKLNMKNGDKQSA